MLNSSLLRMRCRLRGPIGKFARETAWSLSDRIVRIASYSRDLLLRREHFAAYRYLRNALLCCSMRSSWSKGASPLLQYGHTV